MYKTAIACGLFALSAVVQAQGGNTSCSNSSGFQIESQSDLDALASCSTVTGSIIVSAVAMDAVNIPSGVLHVTGDVSVSLTSSVVTFSAPGLESIGGTFELLNLTALQSVNAPSLTSVGGINFVILPLLTTMTFGINEAGNIVISDTQLASLDGFSLTTVNDFGINNNRYLTSISQPNLKEVNGALNIAANSPNLQLSFPDLLTVQNASFRNIAAISFNGLQNVTSNLGFFDSIIPSIVAPNLTSIGSSLAIVNCTDLSNVSFPQLTTIGGTFLIANNTDLTTISGFPKVSTVGGSIDWTGTFDNASLPDISDVRGGINVQSSSQTFQCPFSQLQNNGVVKGKGFVCTGKVSNPSSGVNGTNQTANSGGQSGSGSKSAATQITSHAIAFAATSVLVAFAMQYLL